MSEKNGKTRWLIWLAGAMLTIIVTSIVSLANNTIVNDNNCRSRLHDHEVRFEDKIEKHYEQNAKEHQKITNSLARIETILGQMNGQ